ncbi:MAG: hypothetical protein ACKO6N_12850 [Myxococcota bacterium]
MSKAIESSAPRFRTNARLAASWRVLGELFRRHHVRCDLRVLELHPCGGTYDCLGLYARRGDDPFGLNIIQLNVPSQHIHFFTPLTEQRNHPLRFESGADYVQALFCYPDPKDLIDAIEARAGLPPCPVALPASSRPVLTIRALGRLLERYLFDRRTINVRCAWYDDAGYGSSIAEWARAIPALAGAVALPDWRTEMHMASRFWRVTQEDSDRHLILDFGAAVIYADKRVESMYELYLKEGRRLEPVVDRLWSLMM